MEAQKFHNLFDRRPIAKSRAPATKWFKEWKKGFRVQRRKEWGLQSLRLRRLLPTCSAIVLVRRSRDFWNYADVLIEETRDFFRFIVPIDDELVVTVPKGPHEEDGEDCDIEAEHLVFVQLGIDESREATMVARENEGSNVKKWVGREVYRRVFASVYSGFRIGPWLLLLPFSADEFQILHILETLSPHNAITHSVLRNEMDLGNLVGLCSFALLLTRGSELPLEVKDRILECLPTREAARTALLSRHWNDVWLQHGRLVFDMEFLESVQQCQDDEGRTLVKIVHNILFFRAGPIKKFTLQLLCDGPKPQQSTFDRWCRFLSRNGVEELNLSLESYECYKLPFCLLYCKTIKQLIVQELSIDLPAWYEIVTTSEVGPFKELEAVVTALIGVFADPTPVVVEDDDDEHQETHTALGRHSGIYINGSSGFKKICTTFLIFGRKNRSGCKHASPTIRHHLACPSSNFPSCSRESTSDSTAPSSYDRHTMSTRLFSSMIPLDRLPQTVSRTTILLVVAVHHQDAAFFVEVEQRRYQSRQDLEPGFPI
nr:F-box/FBD/LRR-repeat protein At1g13570-like [Ipomoea batatas]